jgi:hypothetical protein
VPSGSGACAAPLLENHASESAFALVAIVCDEVDQDRALKKLEQFLDGGRIGEKVA